MTKETIDLRDSEPLPIVATLTLRTQLAIEAFREVLMAENRLRSASIKLEDLLPGVPEREQSDYDLYTQRLRRSFEARI